MSVRPAPPHVPEAGIAAAARFHEAANSLDDRSAWPLKIFVVSNLFLWHLDAFAGDDDPVPPFVGIMDRACALLNAARDAVDRRHFPPTGEPAAGDEGDVGEIYGDAWVQLTDANYFDESPTRLRQRLLANQVDPESLFRGKTVLDAGCGCGNYTLAMADLGAREVIGIDIGEDGLEFGRSKAAMVGHGDRVSYRWGSADEIPLPDESVDLVWSNSVVHVSRNYEACLREAARVLRPNGMIFLYVDGRMGLFELLMDTLRQVLRDVPRSLTQHYLALLGVDPGRITWMLANFYVFYERRPKAEVEALLRRSGFAGLRQLVRGLPTDPIEQLSAGAAFGEIKYGEGQLKYLATRA